LSGTLKSFVLDCCNPVRLLLMLWLPGGSLPEASDLSYRHFRIWFHPSDSAEAVRVIDGLQERALSAESFLGILNPDPVEVFLAGTPEDFLRLGGGAVPDWGGAVAIPDKRRIVMKTSSWLRDEGYTVSPPAQIVMHEYAHILFADAGGDRPSVPVWLNEGCAMVLGAEPPSEHAMAGAQLTGSLMNLALIDDLLRFDRVRAKLAYEQSHSAVRYLTEQFGAGVVEGILSEVKRGIPFEAAFLQVTGMRLSQFETAWHASVKTGSPLAWTTYLESLIWYGIIPVLFIAAWLWKRRVQRARLDEWDREEGVPPPPD
jgi:hypothetical protein